MGWFSVSAIAMGGSNQSLFVIGALMAAQGSAAVPLMVVGLLLSWMALPGWIELTLMWPNRVGGIAAVCAEAFRPYSAVLANLTGVCYWWGWVPTCGITALLAASALHQWYLPGIPVTGMAIAIIAAAAVLNLTGLKRTAAVAKPMAIVSALLALLSGLLPVLAGKVDWHRAASFHLVTPFHGVFGGITSAMAGLYLIGFAAPAFEAAACHVGELKSPISEHPRSMYASAIMASLYFVALPVIWLGVFGSGPLQHELSATLGPTFAPLFGAGAKAAAIWFLVFNMLHGTLQPLSGATRTLLQLGEDGLLPRMFAKRMARTDAPWFAIVLTATLASVIVLMGAPIRILAAANLTYLIGICLPSVAVWLLRRNEPERERPYRAKPGLVTLGVGAACVWLVSTLLGFEQYGLPTVLTGLGFAYAGAIAYLWRVFSDRRRAGLPRRHGSLHAKLTGSMLAVIAFDGAGYLLAVSHVHGDPTLRAVLQDIFVAVAILTISVGLVLPGMIGQSARQLSGAATRLAAGTLSDLTKAMQALARGDLNAAHARKEILELRAYSRDELGEMADTFNVMQKEIARTAVALDGAREGLAQTKQELAQYAAEQAQLARTEQVMREATDRANQAKSEFLSRVSHELRTPLNAILGFGQLLELENLSDSQRDSLDQMLVGGRHLLELIDELLDISRIETENMGLSVEPLDVRASIEEAVALCEPLAAERGLTLRVRNHREPVWAKADAQRLKQVILNLISNAIKYNRPDGSVTVEAVAEEADVVRISVTDTGLGIDELELDRLFTPFERLSAPSRGVEGTGLGLALSKTLIEAMGGRIEVNSRAGVGSTFCVVLEASEEPEVVAESSPVAGAPMASACSDMSATILCIEDNPANLRVIEQLLARSLTASVVAAPTGKLGLELARIRQPDVILLDLHLPDCNGETVLSALRSDPGTAAIPVVVITADASAGRIKRLMALGADHYLTKPIHARRLVRTLEQHLGAAEASAVA